ncbi:MAG: hypothetical protein ACRDHF_08235 [Tepidiformaceae bacterium]
MAKVSVIAVEELDELWRLNRMPEKRVGGVLTEIIAYSSAAGNPAYAGGTSRIVKLLTRKGQHIGTIHEIVMPDGTRPHSHPKDYTLRDCSRVRTPVERPQTRAD